MHNKYVLYPLFTSLLPLEFCWVNYGKDGLDIPIDKFKTYRTLRRSFCEVNVATRMSHVQLVITAPTLREMRLDNESANAAVF